MKKVKIALYFEDKSEDFDALQNISITAKEALTATDGVETVLGITSYPANRHLISLTSVHTKGPIVHGQGASLTLTTRQWEQFLRKLLKYEETRKAAEPIKIFY